MKFFFDEDVNFIGHLLKENGNLIIDIKNGNRPSGEDWTPDYSIIYDGMDSEMIPDKYKKDIDVMIEHLRDLPEKSYIDFAKLKDGYLFYHDMVILLK
ncbi:MAG TPA: hypothetical protein ENH46_05355 [Candidatus Pacearchaeota archaeon]|nr:hypothetical protein [Candidatus Pacearchaeota archaeon]